ncbi:hypothetical protein [Hymenobacter negativus]|uniref:Uncharacterized protein n=1 Tax=Hymenobacter negativus TaxID=2795026 RepID=A0ABS0QB39_9BACT|nr:hypothetical protein [Hymenobacter negativus]MBH8559548.1 hypothetical protein [Hymenobacter negativus]
MKPLAKFVGAALVGVFALLVTPAAQAQVGVNINIGTPAWGPQVPYGTQYYYIPEIDGYYDLYNQQYIVYQDGYWVPLPELYGYDPYQFHPVIVDYRGPQPWLQIGYYRQHYAYQPYRNYGPGRGYYNGGYGYGPSYGRSRYDNRGGYSYGDRDRDNRGGYPNGRNYGDHDRDDHGGYRGNDNHGQYPGGGYNTPRGNSIPQQGGGGYNPGQGNHGGFGGGQGQQGGGQGNNGRSNGGGNHGGGRGRD